MHLKLKLNTVLLVAILGVAETLVAQTGGGSLTRESGATQSSSHATERSRPVARRPAPKAAATRSAEWYNSQGDEYLSAHKYELAADAYKQALRLKPEFAEPHYSLGWIRNERNE